jgi:hypothetical protein
MMIRPRDMWYGDDEGNNNNEGSSGNHEDYSQLDDF